MKTMYQQLCLLWVGLAFLSASCQQPPPPPTPPTPLYPEFNSARAWKHVNELSALGSRVTGSQQSVKARAYLRTELEAMGLEVQEKEHSFTTNGKSRKLINLSVDIPGSSSSELFVLAAHYDSPPVPGIQVPGANEGASGAALLLELARALKKIPLFYSVRLVWLDGDVFVTEPESIIDALPGSYALANQMKENNEIDRIRFLIYFDQIADANLEYKKDLYSNKTFRDMIWSVARELGYQKEFPPNAGFEGQIQGHRIFQKNGVRAAVSLADLHYRGGEGDSEDYWRTERDVPENCSQKSLAITGHVSIVALNRISQFLVKIDSARAQ